METVDIKDVKEGWMKLEEPLTEDQIRSIEKRKNHGDMLHVILNDMGLLKKETA